MDRNDIIRHAAAISKSYIENMYAAETESAASAVDVPKKKKIIADDPEIMKFWDYEKNVGLDPKKISPNSRKKAFWRCSICGWEKETSVSARARTNGKCPGHDTFKSIVPGVSDFLTVVPEVREYFDPEMNPGADYEHMSKNSTEVLKWHCKYNCGNTWELPVHSQIYRGKDGSQKIRKCPCELGRSIPSALSQNERALKYLDREKNEAAGLSPDDITVGSNKLVYWKCPNTICGYSWKKSPKDQLGSVHMCPCCERNVVIVEGVNDLFTLSPESKELYDFEANERNGIKHETLTVTSGDVVHWKCDRCGKKWTQVVRTRFDKDGRFMKCKRCHYVDKSDMVTVADIPEMLKDWDFKGNKVRPAVVSIADTKKQISWKRKECGHSWVSTAFTYNRLGECPVCARERNSVISLFPQITDYILPEDNEGFDMEILNRTGINNYTYYVSVRCPKCGKIRRNMTLKNVIKQMSDGTYTVTCCKECGSQREIPYYEEFEEMRQMWDSEANGLNIENVPREEEKNPNYWWTCQRPGCKRSFQQSVSILGLCFLRGSNGCPYCNRQKVIPGQSFADLHPELMDEYSPRNDIDPYDVFPNNGKRVLWECTKDASHPSWSATFAERHVGCRRCPVCFPTYAVPGVNTLAAVYPEIAQHWHETNEKPADQVLYNALSVFSWKCRDCGGRLNATISEMLNDTYRCSCCNIRVANPGINTFDVTQPEQLKDWDYVANYGLGIFPNSITEKSRRKVWWTCENDPSHHYCMSPYTRTFDFVMRKKEPCIYCQGRRRKLRRFF